MRVFREITPESKNTRTAESYPQAGAAGPAAPVKQQRAVVEKSLEPLSEPGEAYLRPRYSPEEYRQMHRGGRMGAGWKQYYVIAALVLICAGIVYLAVFSREKPQQVTNQPTASSVPQQGVLSVPEEESSAQPLSGELPQKVRVLLNAASGGYTHGSVVVRCDQDSWLEDGDTVTTITDGSEILFESDSWSYGSDTIRLYSADQEARFTLSSLRNALGDPPAYRGCVEITRVDGGFRVINEVFLEQYLYAVITSEMPESFGLEALKAQAVCARSFALTQIRSGKYEQYAADLDDSVSSQTYNDWPETELSIQAVEETRGMVMTENGEVISANYFSTSCGMTGSYADAWLTGSPDAEGPRCMQGSREYSAPDFGDLSDENNFRQFITSDEVEAPEAGEAWFRWKVRISRQDLEAQIANTLPTLGSQSVRQLDSSGAQFEAYDGGGIGTLQSIYVYNRASSGMIREVLLEGSDKTVKITGEYAIRCALAPRGSSASVVLTKNDGSEKENMSALPSAFWCADHEVGDDGSLSAVTFYGGGYGHGVGMSQVGAWKMAEKGADYQAILKHYYSGITIGML